MDFHLTFIQFIFLCYNYVVFIYNYNISYFFPDFLMQFSLYGLGNLHTKYATINHVFVNFNISGIH